MRQHYSHKETNVKKNLTYLAMTINITCASLDRYTMYKYLCTVKALHFAWDLFRKFRE